MQQCQSCENEVETHYDCPDCENEYCAECRAPVNHDCPANQVDVETESVDQQPGIVKRNAGWILSGLLGFGSLAGQSVSSSLAGFVGQLVGVAIVVVALGYVFQRYSRWNVDHNPSTA